MKKTILFACKAIIAGAVSAATAQGQNLPATLIDIDPGLGITGTVDSGSFTQEYRSGVMNFTSPSGDFQAFCIDPVQGISYGESLIYQIQNPLSLITADNVARLVGGYLASLTSAQTASEMDQTAAAMHWAIWEVTTETSGVFSLASGNVSIDSSLNQDTITLANQFLANMNSYTPATVTFLTNPDRQDIVVWSVIPEPSSAGLLVISGLLVLRRRRR